MSRSSHVPSPVHMLPPPCSCFNNQALCKFQLWIDDKATQEATGVLEGKLCLNSLVRAPEWVRHR